MPETQPLGTLHQVPYSRGGLPALLTVPEVAAMLRVDASTVYRAVQQGNLRAVRLGGSGSTVRIPVAAVEELLAGPEPKEAA
jgi:excisionase family DNA binding protein